MATKQIRIKRLIIFVLVLLLLGSYAGYVLTQPIAALQPTKTFTYNRPAKDVSLSWPSYGEAAAGAAGYGVLETHGTGTPRPTASVIKVLTALSVLQEKPLSADESGPLITLTTDDVTSYNKYVAEGGSVVRVAAGEQLSEYQALEALLLPSANNMAETLAHWAFGSIGAYNAYANAYALTIGMTSTTVTDPSGFLPTTISTPHDLILLGEAGLANPVIAQIVDETTATIPVQGPIYNVNSVLGRQGVIGIKTGNNDQDTGCFLAAATGIVGAHTITVVSVIMDAPNLYTAMHDSLPMLQSIAGGFHAVSAVRSGDVAATYQSPWQDRLTAVAGQSVSLVAWDGSTITASLAVHTVTAPAAAHATVGSLTVTDGASAATYTAPVTLGQALKKPNIFWRFTHPNFVQ